MTLFQNLLSFVKADAEKKGIPVLITFLTSYAGATNAVGRALALAKLNVDAVAAGATVLQDVGTDLATELTAELTAIQANPAAP